MAESVGQIGLDLVINQNQFQSQLNGIKSVAKKAGAVIASAFAVKGIVNFGKECLELGSDLAEVLNVVDVAFPNMSSTIDKFAKSAAAQFGLSETMAKRYAGTFGSMASAFGFTEKEAANMSTTLTGLAGDVASFYNISQDEAYTKIKSVFTGETESLKDLGVVMTQTALDQYALANGYGKTTAKMNEQEKVALRYAFVQQQLSNATGDFARTSDSWANQTRLLALQFDSLKASLGQGLINVFTPVIKAVNVLLGKLATLASAFKAFTNLITGNKNAEKSTSGIATGMENASEAASDASSNVQSIGDSATKAAKKVEKSLAGFDKINKLSAPTSDESSSSGSSGGGSSTGSQVNYGSLNKGENEQLKSLGKSLDKIKSKFESLKSLFAKGFSIGFQSKGFSQIKKSLSNIKSNIIDIFDNPKVANAADNWAKKFSLNLGKVVGASASIATSIATMLVGGVDNYLEQNKEYLKNKLVKMLDISSRKMEICGNFATAISDIFTVFEGPDAMQIVADVIDIFSTAFLECVTLSEQFGTDVLDAITAPIIKNKDKIKNALSGTLGAISTNIGTIKKAVEDTFIEINKVYDSNIKPLITTIKNTLTSLVGTILDNYNKYVAPMLNRLALKIDQMYTKSLKPMISKAISLIGSICDCISVMLESYLKPLAEWIIKTIIPLIVPVIETIAGIVITQVGNIATVIKGIITVIKGVVDFITGVFSGDWKKAWDGIKGIFSGFFTALKGILATVGTVISGPFKVAWSAISTTFKGMGSWFQTKYDAVKTVFVNVGTFFSEKFTGAYDKVKSAFANVKSFFKEDVWGAIKGCFSNVVDWFSSKFSAAWTAVKDVFSTGGKIFTGIKEGIADTFKTVVNGLIDGINKIIKVPFNSINGMLNKIRGVGIGDVKPFEGLWKENPITTPQIPKLAQGGFVKKNTPQLAMIGDNRHQGEVVAPENKLQAMVDEAVSKAGGNGITKDELARIMDRAVIRIIAALSSVGFNIDGEQLARLEKAKKAALDRRFNSVTIG